jgi:hypothetical protein
LDIFWLGNERLPEPASPNLDQLATEIVEDLEAALAQFRAIASE